MPDPVPILTRAPDVTFGTKLVAPPSPVYIGPGDFLTVKLYTSLAVTIVLHGRVLLPSGEIKEFERLHAASATDRTLSSESFQLGEVFLLNLSVTQQNVAIQIGTCYVVVTLTHGSAASRVEHTTLASGYCAQDNYIYWPGRPGVDSLTGKGLLRVIPGTNPAAGAEILETVPTGARWRFIAMRAVLVTDATVATRVPSIVFQSAVPLEFLRIGPQTGQGLSTTGIFSWLSGQGYDSGALATIQSIGVPGSMWLAAGHRIATVTTNLQAGDDWAAPVLFLEEYLEP